MYIYSKKSVCEGVETEIATYLQLTRHELELQMIWLGFVATKMCLQIQLIYPRHPICTQVESWIYLASKRPCRLASPASFPWMLSSFSSMSRHGISTSSIRVWTKLVLLTVKNPAAGSFHLSLSLSSSLRSSSSAYLTATSLGDIALDPLPVCASHSLLT